MPFKPIITDDASITVYDEWYQEAMHSLSGAYHEAVNMHVFPSGVLDKTGNIRVLDIGFGLGYNVCALLHEALKTTQDALYTVISLEKNRDVIYGMENVRFNDERDEIYRLLKQSVAKGKIATEYVQHSIMFGDARQLLSLLPQHHFDIVFHDPFSPAKNPELWTVDFFKTLYTRCSNGCVMTTYSAAVHIRVAMRMAGFVVGKGPQVGRKKEGTIAAKGNGYIVPLSEEYFERLTSEPKAIPFTDPLLNDTPDAIRERRKQMMHEYKKQSAAPIECIKKNIL